MDVDRPAAWRSRKKAVTGSTGTSSASISRYGSSFVPVATSRPTWGTAVNARSLDGCCSIVTPRCLAPPRGRSRQRHTGLTWENAPRSSVNM